MKKKLLSEMSVSELPKKVREAVEALANPLDKRYLYEVAADIGKSERTLERWQALPAVKEIQARVLKEAKSHSLVLLAYKALVRKVVAGDVSAIKELLDRTEGSVKQKHDHSGDMGLEIIHRYIRGKDDKKG